jgi:energy-coupling factor transporter ATP-binding protein EcfA2
MARTEERPPAQVQVLGWEEFCALFLKAHRQGEHVAGVGPTGCGKSTVLLQVAALVGSRRGRDQRPARVTILGTKRRDDTLSKFIARTDFQVIKAWPPAYGQEHAVVWPRGLPPSKRAERHRVIFRPLLDTIHAEGGQTVEIDEEAYFEQPEPQGGLGLAGTMDTYWSEARSSKLTLIAGTQRPRNVSRLMWSEPSWLIIFPPEDADDLKRVAELSGRKDDVLEIVPRLGGYEFLCVRRQRSGQRGLYVSRVGAKRR